MDAVQLSFLKDSQIGHQVTINTNHGPVTGILTDTWQNQQGFNMQVLELGTNNVFHVVQDMPLDMKTWFPLGCEVYSIYGKLEGTVTAYESNKIVVKSNNKNAYAHGRVRYAYSPKELRRKDK
jgi:hypothetical protein